MEFFFDTGMRFGSFYIPSIDLFLTMRCYVLTADILCSDWLASEVQKRFIFIYLGI